MPSHESPTEWGEVNTRLDEACSEVGRDRAEVRRSVQLFLHPRDPERVTGQLTCSRSSGLGCEHAVLSFYQPPDAALLERTARAAVRERPSRRAPTGPCAPPRPHRPPRGVPALEHRIRRSIRVAAADSAKIDRDHDDGDDDQAGTWLP